MIIHDRYFDRLGKYKLSRMQDEASGTGRGVPPKSSTKPTHTIVQNPPVDVTPVPSKTSADNGDPFTILVSTRSQYCLLR